MSAPKTHLELFGWELRRGCRPDQFVLRVRGYVTDMACGPLEFVIRQMRRFIDQGIIR